MVRVAAIIGEVSGMRQCMVSCVHPGDGAAPLHSVKSVISSRPSLSTGEGEREIMSLFRLLLLPIRLALLPIKLIKMGITFMTCIVPLLVVLGIVGLVAWFLIR